jgi:hypothetical protein
MGRTACGIYDSQFVKGTVGPHTQQIESAAFWFRVCDVRCGLGIAIATANAEKKASKHGQSNPHASSILPARWPVKHEAGSCDAILERPRCGV